MNELSTYWRFWLFWVLAFLSFPIAVNKTGVPVFSSKTL
jgi:hypothetical protein